LSAGKIFKIFLGRGSPKFTTLENQAASALANIYAQGFIYLSLAALASEF